jgi:hypothetical protein
MSGQGAAIGAATGATYALATGKDPVKYAMIGGAVGGTGGALAGAAGAGTAGASTAAAGTAGTSSALTGAGASTAANTAYMAPAGVNAGTMINASQAAAPSTFMGASQAPGIFAPPPGGYQSLTAGMQQPLTYDQATAAGMQRPIGFLESAFNPNIESSSMAPSFMEQVGSGAGQVGQYAQQNPVLTQMAMQSAQQALQQPEARMAPAGQVSRGQIQGGDYMSLLNPQQGSVIRPQPISLLG